MEILLFSIYIIYCFFILFIISGLFRHNTITFFSEKELPSVSIVIAARNEENNLPNLIEDLCRQNYLQAKAIQTKFKQAKPKQTRKHKWKPAWNIGFLQETMNTLRENDRNQWKTITNTIKVWKSASTLANKTWVRILLNSTHH